MKKLLLIIALCLFSFNAYTKEKTMTDDVDVFFSKCKDIRDRKVDFSSGVCLGYIDGISGMHLNGRFLFKTISPKCNFTTGEVLDRFLILYQRNQFEIGSSVSNAIVLSITSICPYITAEQYDKEIEELKNSLKFQE